MVTDPSGWSISAAPPTPRVVTVPGCDGSVETVAAITLTLYWLLIKRRKALVRSGASLRRGASPRLVRPA